MKDPATALRAGCSTLAARLVSIGIAAAAVQAKAAGDRFDELLAGGLPSERVALAKTYEASGTQEDAVKAARLYYAVAAAGDADAQCAMSRLYSEGRGLKARPEKAYVWALAAARQGHAEAQNLVGVYCSEGTGVARDARQAAAWFRKAAFGGNVKAQFNLGACFETGDGVPQDPAQAAQWYRKAAESGCAPAQFRMGVFHERGSGVARDVAKASEWYARGAESGDADAQFAYGRCLELGAGVARNAESALAWYRKAAAQGDDRARQRILHLESAADSGPGLVGLSLGMPMQTAAIVLERALREAGVDAMLFVVGTGATARVVASGVVEMLADAEGGVASVFLDRDAAVKLFRLKHPARGEILAAAAEVWGFDPGQAVAKRSRLARQGRSLGTQDLDVIRKASGDELVCFGSYAAAAEAGGAEPLYRPVGSLLLQKTASAP